MTTYTQIAKKVLSWANRDLDVLSYEDIKDFINYGVDTAYRTLRVAPMESISSYTTSSADTDDYKLTIPTDLVEIIQLRKTNKTDGSPSERYDVFQAKEDIRSFYDEHLPGTELYYFSRERNVLTISPAMKDSETYELYYYRRLPETDARYDTMADTENTSYQYYATSQSALMTLVKSEETSDVFIVDPELEDRMDSDTDGNWRLGKLAPNWLRDNNERVILYGALMQAGIYLGEMEMEQRFTELLNREILALNNEDNLRRASGGVVQTRFTANGMI